MLLPDSPLLSFFYSASSSSSTSSPYDARPPPPDKREPSGLSTFFSFSFSLLLYHLLQTEWNATHLCAPFLLLLLFSVCICVFLLLLPCSFFFLGCFIYKTCVCVWCPISISSFYQAREPGSRVSSSADRNPYREERGSLSLFFLLLPLYNGFLQAIFAERKKGSFPPRPFFSKFILNA